MMYHWASYEKKFASLKSMKKGVGSGSEAGSISQRYGSGDRIRIRTKMSRIPNTWSNIWKLYKSARESFPGLKISFRQQKPNPSREAVPWRQFYCEIHQSVTMLRILKSINNCERTTILFSNYKVAFLFKTLKIDLSVHFPNTVRYWLVLRIRIWDPVPFWHLDPGFGMVKKSGYGSEMNNPNRISESLEIICLG